MLKKRILTALVLIPITVALIFMLSQAAFGYLTLLITVLAAWEWGNLMQLRSALGRLIYLFIVGICLFSSLFIPAPLILALASIWWLIAFLLVFIYPRGWATLTKGILIRGLMGLFVLVPTWVAINYIRNQTDGIKSLLFLFVLIWGADSCAYFVGKKWGTTKLAPQLSPGKSWQGIVGAFFFTIIFAVIAQWFFAVPPKWLFWGTVLSVVVVFFSVVGDLFESALKRQADLKDSGRLLPGHGGLLDRIDSLTAAAPVYAMGATLLGFYLLH